MPTLLPRVDVLALQEADKRTQRAGGHHVARELAEELQMAWIHVPAGIPRGQEPKPRHGGSTSKSKSDFMTRATQASPYSGRLPFH